MAVFTVTFTAQSLQKQQSLTIILPDRVPFKHKLPVLYQLHGLSDNNTGWTRLTSIERYVSTLPLIVAMPDGGRGFYCDAAEGPAYESHIVKDVVGFVEKFFPVRKDRDARAIGGLSMGGYGAMKLALKHPDMFCSVVSHSSAFDFAHGTRHDSPEFRRIFGDKPTGGPDDLFTIAEKLDRAKAPAVRFDCGTKDGLLPSSRAFHKHLLRLHIPHQYKEYPGDHNWAYWDVHVQEAIKFHWKHLRHEPVES